MMALQVDLSVVTLITSTLIMFRRNFLTRNPNIAAVLVFNDFFITYFGFAICSFWAHMVGGGWQNKNIFIVILVNLHNKSLFLAFF